MFSGILLAALITAIPCGSHSDIIEHLQRKYGEEIIGSAVANGGYLIEIMVNKTTGTWSFLMTQPMGLTCLMEKGSGWRDSKTTLGDEDA